MVHFWYETAVIYAIDLQVFFDSDGDGIGDLTGLEQKLEYLARLGVDCVWLLPCFPSPMRDDGYDVSDYYGIDPRLGTLGDFVRFMQAARERGIRVLMDLVVQHSSDQHPWFQDARRNPRSKYRDFYVWSEKPGKNYEIVFPGKQEGNWTRDSEAGMYYRHTFYPFEPDLNFANPRVRDEIAKIMAFWVELGVSGFRLDAAPFMLKFEGVEDPPKDPHDLMRELRDALGAQRGDAIFLAEADHDPKRVHEFFGRGDEMQMIFNFILDERLILALVRKDVRPIVQALEMVGPLPRGAQPCNFLRNHDELSLGGLSQAEQHDVMQALAPRKEMRAYGRGIRRRLAPMFDGDRRRLELAYSLLFALPGTPLILYGEEIGMSENLDLAGRLAMRTPMQWSEDPNAGFSTAPQDKLIRPANEGGKYGFRQCNTLAEWHDPGSLLNWMRTAIATRRAFPEFGRGDGKLLDTGETSVLAMRIESPLGNVLSFHNLSDQPRTVKVELTELEARRLAELMSDGPYEASQEESGRIRLNGYGYRWFRATRQP